MAGVAIEGVRKSFARVEVLKGVSTGIEDGELRVVLGPSGCGKSTLLRLVAGLEEITSGTIRIDGRVVNDLEPKDRDIAMVFQNYALYPHMSVYDNMAYLTALPVVMPTWPDNDPSAVNSCHCVQTSRSSASSLRVSARAAASASGVL